MKKVVHTICIFLSLAFAFVAVTFCWFSRGELLNFRKDFGSAKASYFGGGDGSRDKPYEISSETHFYNFAWLQYLGYFNHAEANNGRYQSYFRLADNIDMSGLNSALPPIGTSKYPFIGNFDGCGYTVKNVTISNKLNGSDGEALTNYLTVRPTVADNFAANKTVLPVWGDTSKDVNIVGLFGVTGDYGSTATAGGVVQEAYGIYSESNTAGKLQDTLKKPAESISDDDANSTEKAYYGAMSVANFYADNLHVRSASDSTLVGLAAGYANAAIGSVGVYRCDITVNAGATGLSDSAPLSNYSLLGDYNDAVITWDEEPSGGGGGGSGNDWGGSIDFYDLSKRITYILNKNQQYNSFTITNSKNNMGLNGISFTYKTDKVLYEMQGNQINIYGQSYFPLNVDTEKEFKNENRATITNNGKTITYATTDYFSDSTKTEEAVLTKNPGFITTTNNQYETTHDIWKNSKIGASLGFTKSGASYPSGTYNEDNLVMLNIDESGNLSRIVDGNNITNNTNLNDIQSTTEATKLQRYAAVKKEIKNFLTNDNNYIYGWTWNTSATSTIKGTFKMNGINYTDVLAPGIDFIVGSSGYITAIFCPNANGGGGNKLFTLYKVTRNGNKGTPTATKVAGKIPTETGDFDIKSALLYLEIHVDAGEYFISADVDSGANTSDNKGANTSAGLMYLDIGANAGGDGGGSAPGTAAYTIDTVDFVNNTTDYAANGKFTAFKDVTFNLSGAGTSGVPSVSFERAAAADGEDTAATKVAYIYSNITVLVTPSDGSLSSGTEKKENAA